MLKQQYQRTRSMLEKAMMERTEYGLSEIESMSKHMVAGPLVRNLVMICNDSIGFTGTDIWKWEIKRQNAVARFVWHMHLISMNIRY